MIVHTSQRVAQNLAHQLLASFDEPQPAPGAFPAPGSDTPLIQHPMSADPVIRTAVLCAVQAALSVSRINEMSPPLVVHADQGGRGSPPRAGNPPRGDKLLDQAIQNFLASRESIGRNSASTIREKYRSLNAFNVFVQNERGANAAPVTCGELNRELTIEFTEFVARGGLNPSEASEPKKEGTPTDISQSQLTCARPSARTIIKVIGHLKQFFAYAKAKNFVVSNPIDDDFKEACKEIWAEVALARRHNSYLPFKGSHLAAIFDPRQHLAFNPQADYFWLPLLALYSCARLSELASLTVRDIRFDANAGVHYLNLVEVDEETGETLRRLKNVHAIRRVPIASQLIQLGFIDYVQRVEKMGATKLFPHVRETPTNARDPGKNGGRHFGAYLDHLGIRSKRLVFHSFRHLGITRLLGAGVPLADSELIAGHAAQDIALAAARAGQSKRAWMSTQVLTYMHKTAADDDESEMLRRLKGHIDRALNFDQDLDLNGLRKAAEIVAEHTVVMKGQVFKSGWHTNAKAHCAEMLNRLAPFCTPVSVATV